MSSEAIWTDLEIIKLSEESWTEKEKYHMISLTHGILKKKARSDLIYKTEKKLRDFENKLMVTKVERLGGEIN